MRYLMILPLLVLGLALTVGAADTKAEKAEEKPPAVSIKSMQFSPTSLTIKVGQTVTWTNNDDRDHTVVSSEGGKAFKSENISSKGTFRHKFDKKGKYPYSCSYHPRMKGAIVVEE